MRSALRVFGLVVGLSAAWLTVTAAGAASINANPTSVPVGGTVTISGDVLAPGGQPGCALPGAVSLFSGAFGDLNTPVQATAGADAKFSVSVTIPSGVAPGSYTVTGRCGGGNLGVQATLVVTGTQLPSTGTGGLLPATAQGSAPAPAAIALIFGLAGLMLLAGAWSLRNRLWTAGGASSRRRFR